MAAVLNLQSFTSIPGAADLLTIGEVKGAFVYATEEDFLRKAANLGLEAPTPIVIDEQEMGGDLSLVSSSVLDQPAFVPVQEYWLKRAWYLLYEEGSLKALEYLSERDDSEDEDRGHLITNCASLVLNCLRRFQYISSWIISPLPVNHHDLCDLYARCSLWSSSVIRDISVHPHLPLVAIGRKKDDVILINDIQRQTFLKPLRYRHQYCIACLEWAPLSNGMLAVGVVGGVVLWYVDSNKRSIANFLACFHQQPVISISWCPQGRYLACGSPNDPTLLIWDTALRTNAQLKRYRGGGITHVHWSPTGGKLLVSHHSLFRVWDCVNWTCERWTQLIGHCNASCWSPKGDLLVFAVKGDTSLYYVRFSSHDSTSANRSISDASIKCADVAECSLVARDGEEIRIGGSVQSLAWDQSGERLAVLFTADSAGACRIAVFRTQCYPVLELLPGGFIQWIEDALPVWVGFTSNHGNKSTLVTGWNNGEITFTPLQYFCNSRTARTKSLENVTPSLSQHQGLYSNY